MENELFAVVEDFWLKVSSFQFSFNKVNMSASLKMKFNPARNNDAFLAA